MRHADDQPEPSIRISVKVDITQSGDYAASTGQRIVTIGTSGATALSIITRLRRRKSDRNTHRHRAQSYMVNNISKMVLSTVKSGPPFPTKLDGRR